MSVGRRVRFVVAVVVLVVVAAGCGDEDIGDGADSTVQPTTSTSRQPTTTVTTHDDPSTTTTTGLELVVELSSASYSQTFVITACDNTGEADLVLEGRRDAFFLTIDAMDGSGLLSVSGGDEQDAITLNGTITEVEKGDHGTFLAGGTFDAPSLVGEEFTAAGAC